MGPKMIQSVVRALTILEIIAKNNGMGVTDIAREMDLSKSTVFGLLKTLEAEGYIFNNQQSNKYCLTFKLHSLSEFNNEEDSIVEFARPHLESLAKKYEETIHFVVESNNEVHYLAKIESTKSIRVFTGVGSSMPLYCTGVGKAILSTKSDEEIIKYSKEIDFIKYTDNTITNVDDLLEDIYKIQKSGYSIDNEENQKQIYCIATPIKNKKNIAVYALSISMPIFRKDSYNMAKLIEDITKVKKEIEQFF